MKRCFCARLLMLTAGFFLLLTPPESVFGENPDLQGLVDELRTLAEKSRDQRAADRWLQQALEDLVARYDWPWRNELLFESFSDGNYTEDPPWKAVSGRFWVDNTLGLRSRVEPPRKAEPEAPTRDSDSQDNLGRAILGALMKEAFKDEQSRESPRHSEREAPETGPAIIRLSQPITNAFLLEMSFSMHNEPGVEGEFEIALLQNEAGDYGYRLGIGEPGVVDLYRLRRGSRELVSSSKTETGPGDGKAHDLVWRQAKNGQVEVFLDGSPILNLRDNAFQDGYNWLELTNQAGELAVRQVRILGTSEALSAQ